MMREQKVFEKRIKALAMGRMQIKRLLIKYNYPPNKSAKAVETVVKQAELKCQEKKDD